MPAMKAGTTLPDGKRFGIRQADIFRIGRMIEDASEQVPGGVAYKLGQSDETISQLLLEKHQMTVPAEAIARLRRKIIGNYITDKGSAKEKLEQLRREVGALRQQVISHGKLFAGVQKDLEEIKTMVRDVSDHDSSQAGRRQQQPSTNGHRRY